MHVKRNKFSRLRHELRRRKTDRVIVAYAAAAFAILQLVQLLSEEFILPSWTMTVLIVVLATGFPVAAIISWFFDITPGGIEKTLPVSDKKKARTDTRLDLWVLGSNSKGWNSAYLNLKLLSTKFSIVEL